MKNRREFLKEMAASAAVLGAECRFVFGEQAADATGRSRVVIVTDPHLRDQGPAPSEQRVAAMLDRAMQTWFRARDPMGPWQQLVRRGQIVGLKVNTIAGKGLSTSVVLVDAICRRLQQAGIRAGDIIVWDRTSRELQAAGYSVFTDPAHVRCCGTDSVGYELADAVWGSSRTRFSKLLTQCDVVINVPILKNHRMSGVTMAMKNMFGVIENPNEHHGDGSCDPCIADLNMHREIRSKVRFVIGDLMTSIYHGGPGFRPEYTWNYNGLMVGSDPVALDYTGWQIIERKRAEMRMNTLAQAGMPPRYIATAADAKHRLGTNDPSRIELIQTSLA